jgi:hypothetical protein
MPDDRPRARSGDRPPFGGPRPFRHSPRPDLGAGPLHTLRLRDGEREFEVSGSPIFIRQLLDDLPSLWPRLHGEGPARPARISMPAPPPREVAPAPVVREVAPAPVVVEALPSPKSDNGSLDERVLSVLKRAERPLAVAAIRKRLADATTPQQVRRVLERNAERVSVSNDRPATYRLR